MSSIRNKRQQARNERILQDLLKSVPGNDQCADCGTRNPAWASWSLGIFLCMRCASLHRKLGTHISKVKSISMDMWTNEQVDNMRSIGNVKSNAIHNPDVSKHPIPLNTEDSDSQMERHIRNKYEYKLFVREKAQPQNSSTSSVSSGASSSFGATSSTTTGARSVSAGYGSSRNPPFRASSPSSSSSKVSQVLGVGSIPYTDSRPVPPSAPIVFPHGMVTAPQYQEQLQSLKEMGFKDEKKMMEILKSVNGSLPDAADIMLRLGNESSDNGLSAPGGGAGITIHKSGGSVNPFDALDRELPPLPPGATEVGGINPQALPSRAYQNSYQAPTVVPGYGSRQSSLSAQGNLGTNNGGYGQAYGVSMPQQQQLQRQQQQQPPVQAQQTNPYASYGNLIAAPFTGGFTTVGSGTMSAYNPFVDGMVSPSQNLYQPPPQQQQQHNPFLQQSQQPQPQLQPQLQPQDPWPSTPATPSYSIQPQMNPYLSQLPPQHLQQQQITPQRPGIDKSSILALYNFPHLAPQPNGNPSTQPQENQLPVPQPSQNPTRMLPNGSATTFPTPTGSTAGSNNPFLPATSPAGIVGASGGGRGHMSQESVDFGAWQSGRHSPDAFASLSFRQ